MEVGVTTDEIDRIVHEACVDRECYPSPLNYYEFPRSCCTSVNEVICHGIPDLRQLSDGDICNGMVVGVNLNCGILRIRQMLKVFFCRSKCIR